MTTIIKITLTLFILTVFLRTNAQVKVETILPDSNIVFKSDSIEGVIFGKDSLTKNSTGQRILASVLTGTKITNHYVPAIKSVIKVDYYLRSFIHDSDIFIFNNFQNYIKQYYGYLDSNGDSIILINCFFRDKQIMTILKWETELVYVQDGGSYFFHVIYNSTKRKFYNFVINGLG